jgi:hypothetical protein
MVPHKYIKTTYSVSVELTKSGSDVFDHLINLTNWWPEEFEGEKLKPGSEFVLKTGDSHCSKNKVLEFIPGKKLIWLTTESIRKSDSFDWSGTKMIFEITPKSSTTILTFTYDGPVLENESDRLVQICDITMKELFYNYAESFTTTIEVSKSPSDVFHCLTDVSKWWGGEDFEGNSTNLNDVFTVHHPGAHFSKQKLIEVIPENKMVWLVTESTLNWLEKTHEWQNTRMIFELSMKENKTVLRFTHQGLVPQKQCFARCAEGWNMVINNWLLNFILSGELKIGSNSSFTITGE